MSVCETNVIAWRMLQQTDWLAIEHVSDNNSADNYAFANGEDFAANCEI